MTAPQVERGARHLHDLGPRALVEFLTEYAASTGTEADMRDALDRWRRLDPRLVRGVFLATAGGREFPQHLVQVPA